MFNGGKTTQSKTSKRPESSSNSVTIITSGCHFKGKLFCRGSTRIGGTIEGEVSSEGVLIIETGAEVRGNIQADEVVLHGYVEGKIDATISLEISKSGHLQGEINTSCLVIKEGAKFNGTSKMTDVVPTEKNNDRHNGAYSEPDVTPNGKRTSKSLATDVSVL